LSIYGVEVVAKNDRNITNRPRVSGRIKPSGLHGVVVPEEVKASLNQDCCLVCGKVSAVGTLSI